MNFNKLPEDISREVKRWSAMQLWTYSDVYTMQSNGAKYYKTNQQLADLFDTDTRTVRRIISGLVADGALRSYQDGPRRFLSARPASEWGGQKCPPDSKVPRTAKSPGEDRIVRGGGQQSPRGEDSKVPLIEKSNREVNRELNREESASLVFPWESLAFLNAWEGWKAYKQEQFKFKYKSVKSEQIALHKLHKDAKGNERIAIDAIAQSIASGWRGLFPESNSRGSKPGCNTDWVHEIARDIAERNGYQYNEPDAS